MSERVIGSFVVGGMVGAVIVTVGAVIGAVAAPAVVDATTMAGSVALTGSVILVGGTIAACTGAFETRPKAGSFLAGLFTGLAAVGGLVYASLTDPGEAAAAPQSPSSVATLEEHHTPLAAAFERADGHRRIEPALQQVHAPLVDAVSGLRLDIA